MTTSRADLYTQVTQAIIADLERGVRPWVKPWKANHPTGARTPPLRHNGTPYRGINILLLWGASVGHGFSAPMWMTYRQAQACKAHVRKGSGDHSWCMPTASRPLRRTPPGRLSNETFRF
jgi:antirestriction protein ArdC